jgi:hypothetical protein
MLDIRIEIIQTVASFLLLLAAIVVHQAQLELTIAFTTMMNRSRLGTRPATRKPLSIAWRHNVAAQPSRAKRASAGAALLGISTLKRVHMDFVITLFFHMDEVKLRGERGQGQFSHNGNSPCLASSADGGSSCFRGLPRLRNSRRWPVIASISR